MKRITILSVLALTFCMMMNANALADDSLSTLKAVTFLGGSGEDAIYSMVVGPDGNVWIVGTTFSTDFLIPGGNPDFKGGECDAFVAKLSPDLRTLFAARLLGGSGKDIGMSIAFDSSGNVLVGGMTDSADFPWTTGSGPAGGLDLFVVKLTPDLGYILASTIIGGDGWDELTSIAVDSANNVFALGDLNTYSSFPITSRAYKAIPYSSASGVAVKLDANLNLLASTYLDVDHIRTLAVDSIGNVFMGGGYNQVLKMDNNLTTLLDWTDFSPSSRVRSILLDPAGFLYVTGPTEGDYYGQDVYVRKFDASLNEIAVLYMAGSSRDDSGYNGNSLTLDAQGNLYVAGVTLSRDFLSHIPGSYDPSINGDHDAFVAKISPDLNQILAWTYFGGTGSDYAYAVAVGDNGAIYIAGETGSGDLPFTPQAYDPTYNGGNRDGFVAKFGPIIDSDGDTLDDTWEMAHFGTLAYGANDDPDNDRLTNLQEYLLGTNPNNPDMWISGRVTDASNPNVGIVDVDVWTQDLNGNWIGGARTDSNGNYNFKVPPGDYKVGFYPWAIGGYYVFEYYNNKRNFNEANIVTVVAGQTTSDVNAQLETGGRISGRVTDASNPNVGIANVDVYAQDLNGNGMSGARTDSNGNYDFNVLPGIYKVGFDPRALGGSYLFEWYNNKRTLNEADLVTVTVGVTTSNIDAQIDTGNTLTIAKSGTGNGLVTSSPAGINCGPDCYEVYNSGATVTLTANSDGTSRFVSWTGCDSVNGNQCTVNMTTEKTVTANFSYRRLNVFPISVTDGNLIGTFFLWPGFKDLLQSATLTGPSLSYTFDLQADALNWLNECRYSEGWRHIFGPVGSYGNYTLTLQFYDGVVETYTRNLQLVTLTAAQNIGVTVANDGSANVTWTPPATGQYHQVTVRSADGMIEYFRSSPAQLDANSLNISAQSLRCLERGQTYQWQLRTYEAPETYYEGIPMYNAVATNSFPSVYNPSLPVQRTTYYSAMDWNGKLAIMFDVRTGSRGEVTQATVTGPNNFYYQYDLVADLLDLSTTARFNRMWWKQFDPLVQPIEYGDYVFTIAFSDGHTETLTKIFANVPLTPADSGTMTYTILPFGAISFNWSLPQGVSNQQYVVRIQSLDGTKEYYSSPRLVDKNNAFASFGELRGLEHCKTYQWFVRVYDPVDNTMRQSFSQTFFYNPFNLPYNTLTMTKGGNGLGSVTSSPDGINCGNYCSDTFVKGLPVILTATAETGSLFTGWSGACSGTGACTATMDQARTVVVNFTLTYSIVATASGNGSISPSGTVTVNHGETQTFVITPNIHYHVQDVLVDGISVGPVGSYTFSNVTANHTISAMFAIDTYPITAGVISGHGTVNPSTQMVAYGGNTIIQISAGSGYHIVSIADNGAPVPITNPTFMNYIINNVTAEHRVLVAFEINLYPVTASVSGGHGTVSPAVQMVDHGANASIYIYPGNGYHVASISDNGTPVSITNPYVINMVKELHDVVVTFTDTYTITAIARAGGTIYPSGAVRIKEGKNVVFTIIPNYGYIIRDVKVDGESVGPVSRWEFRNVNANHTIEATFSRR